MTTLDERVGLLTARLPSVGQSVAASAVISGFVEVAHQPLPMEHDTGWLMLDLRQSGDSLVLSLGHDFSGSEHADDLQALTIEGTVVGFTASQPAPAPVAVYGDGGHLIDQWVEALRQHPVVRELTESQAVVSGWRIDANTDD